MPRTQDTLASNETIDTAYPNEIQVVEIQRDERPPLYEFRAPLYSPKDTDTTPRWENPHHARMYAAVYVAVGTFREEKTGRRGVPPEVQRDGQEATIAYLTTQDGISTDWLTNFYELPEQRIYEYRSRIRARAEEHGEENDD
ncbi:hypothetical protein [Haloarcula sediminis]|uniref:hypothetical protein n=1 Tax=Haloarcula sediminis TaxID=3111777 RepID=UPI002D7A126C|nr:hypothetical protein [Haloarcula sp. CK38]